MDSVVGVLFVCIYVGCLTSGLRLVISPRGVL